MRDRLIELLKNKPYGYSTYEEFADYLLEKGVIVPPCNINDDLYWIDHNNVIWKQEKAIKGILYYRNGEYERWSVCDADESIDEIGSEFACLTLEDAEKLLEAEKALKEGAGKC